VRHLLAALERRPRIAGLIRQGEGEDHLARPSRQEPDMITLGNSPERVRLLWDVCQILDFRKLDRCPSEAARPDLPASGRWPDRRRVAREPDRAPDRTDGDIDQLTQRIAHIRTWAYVAHRPDWVLDPLAWRRRAQSIEDRLSEALHQALTERFVDRRRAAFNRRIRSGDEMQALVSASNEVLVEGHVIGVLLGLRFIPMSGSGGSEIRPLLAAARRALVPVLAARIGELEAEDDRRFGFRPTARSDGATPRLPPFSRGQRRFRQPWSFWSTICSPPSSAASSNGA
jgi:ATP-dependent RNA helicase SUPV3L1/SUV3